MPGVDSFFLEEGRTSDHDFLTVKRADDALPRSVVEGFWFQHRQRKLGSLVQNGLRQRMLGPSLGNCRRFKKVLVGDAGHRLEVSHVRVTQRNGSRFIKDDDINGAQGFQVNAPLDDGSVPGGPTDGTQDGERRSRSDATSSSSGSDKDRVA